MEKVLQRLAKQLNAYDEASLMSLWDKYAARVAHFEPTSRWQEDALIFGFIQMLRWKNQLFNHNLAVSSKPREVTTPPAAPLMGNFLEKEAGSDAGPGLGDDAKQRGKVLRFRPREDDEPV